MARKLKTYQTSLGFFDQAIAAPSMKAALEALGRRQQPLPSRCRKGAKDPEIIAATMAKPGINLRRPVGSAGPFTKDAVLPTDLVRDQDNGRPRKRTAKPKKQPALKPTKRPRASTTR
jgi:colicin import membrane protein